MTTEGVSGDNFVLPVSKCPFCAFEIVGAWAGRLEEGPAPEEGAFCLCINCAQILIFDEELRPQMPLGDELRVLMEDREAYRHILKVQTGIRTFNRLQGSKLSDQEKKS